jgi:phosphoribosylformimino-5-aminoimidazole carboxamide ribotide isomerase
MRIIPAIDISEGKCVRLRQGDYAERSVYYEDPLEAARAFEAHGLRYLHVVDLDGAKARHLVNGAVLARIAVGTSLHIDFGGGIQSRADLLAAFDAGAQQVTLGSIAASDPLQAVEWLAEFGAERLILGADARDGYIAAAGWLEGTSLSLPEFVADFHRAGFRTCVCTDIRRDGMLTGPALDLYADLLAQLPDLRLVASGGIQGLDDLDALANLGMDAAIIGKAIYEGRIPLPALADWIQAHEGGLPC